MLLIMHKAHRILGTCQALLRIDEVCASIATKRQECFENLEDLCLASVLESCDCAEEGTTTLLAALSDFSELHRKPRGRPKPQMSTKLSKQEAYRLLHVTA